MNPNAMARMVAGSDDKQMIDKTPDRPKYRIDRCIENWKTGNLPARGKKTFFDDEIKNGNKSKIPPNMYALQEDWGVRGNSKLMHGHMKKCQFLAGKKETILSEIIRTEKKRNIPAPCAYNNVPKYKVQQVPKSTDNQMKFCDDT